MKTILLGATLLILSNQAYTQGLYFRIGAGYAIPAAGQTVDGSGLPLSGHIYNTTAGQPDGFLARKVSFSSGVTAKAAIGYMISSHVGVEMNADVCIVPQQYTMDGQNVKNANGAYLINQTVKRNAKLPMFLTESLVYETGGKKASGYARLGIAIPVGGTIIDKQDNTYISALQTKEHLEQELKMSFGIGFASAIGVNYYLSPNVSVFGELSVLSISRYAKTSTVTVHTVGDVNTVPPVAGTVIQYTNNGNYNTQQPTYALPYSNVGLTIGIKVALHKTTTSNANANNN